MHPQKRFSFLKATIGSLIICCSCQLVPGQAAAANSTQELLTNQPLERELAGGETHRYRVKLSENEFLQIRVEQKGIDVALKLSAANGDALARMDSPNDKQGWEILSYIAVRSEEYVLEVSSINSNAAKGSYIITSAAPRAATAGDKRRVEVERLFVEGIEARSVAGQTNQAIEKLEQALAGWKEFGDSYLSDLTAQQINALKGVAYVTEIFGPFDQDLRKAQAILFEGQQLLAKSPPDSPVPRDKFNEALTIFRSLEPRLRDGDFDKRIDQKGEFAAQLREELHRKKFTLKSGEALSLNGLATTYALTREWQAGIDYLKLALRAYQECINDQTYKSDTWFAAPLLSIRGIEAGILSDLGSKIDTYLGRTDESLSFLTEAADRYRALFLDFKRPAYQLAEAMTLSRIGMIHNRESRGSDKSIEFYQRALVIYRQYPDQKFWVAANLSLIASAKSGKFDYHGALVDWNEVLRIYRELDYKMGEVSTLEEIAFMHSLLNNKAKTTETAREMLAVAEAADFVENTSRQLKTGALDSLQKSLIATLENTRLNKIAFAYRLLEDYPKAVEYYEKALASARLNKEPRTISSNLYWAGNTYTKMGKWDKAEVYFRQSLEISRASGVGEEVASSLQDVGWSLLEQRKYQEALEFQSEALLAYQSVGVGDDSAFSPAFSGLLNNLSRTYDGLGNHALAIFYGKRAVNAVQGERRRLVNLDLSAQRGFLEKNEKHYRRLAEWLMNEKRVDEAKQVLALLKEEEVFSYLNQDSSETRKTSLRSDLNQDERAALSRYRALSEKIGVLGSQFGQLQMLQSRGVKLTEKQDREYQDLKDQMKVASQGFQIFLKQLADEFAQRATTSKDLHETLALQAKLRGWGEGVVFLYTLVGDDRYRVILATSDTQIDGKTEIGMAVLNDKIRKFRDAVNNPAIDPRPLGQELYEILIKPVEKQLEDAGAKTLLWSLDGNLRLLPLAALWDGKQYFGQKYQNVIITVASRDNLSEPVSPSRKVLALGVSQAHSIEFKGPGRTEQIPLPALPGAGAEVQSIVKSRTSPKGILPGLGLIDQEFSEAALEAQLLRDYNVVHIASHLNLDPEDGKKSFLLLGDGAVLTLDDLRNNPGLKFHVDLLTLSACNTAVVGKDSSGSEIEGFGYVAQQNGARAILASLWSVADESTQLLMTEFYRLHKENPRLTKAAALKLAQQEMIEGKLRPLTSANKTGPARTTERIANTETAPEAIAFPFDPKKPYAHPYYWAPFILIGNWK